MSHHLEIRDAEPGWIAVFQKPADENGKREEGWIYQPVQFVALRIESVDEDTDQVRWLHYCIHPMGGDLIQAQSHPDFVGLDFLPHHMMLGQMGGPPNGLFVPNRQQRRHPGGLN